MRVIMIMMDIILIKPNYSCCKKHKIIVKDIGHHTVFMNHVIIPNPTNIQIITIVITMPKPSRLYLPNMNNHIHFIIIQDIISPIRIWIVVCRIKQHVIMVIHMFIIMDIMNVVTINIQPIINIML